MQSLTLLLFLSTSLPLFRALNNGLGLTPPMGFSTWNHFGGNVSDTLLRQIADSMVSSGLRDAGYVYINLDDGWAVGRSSNGTIIPDPTLFPNGIKPVADYIHQQGLKFGIYTARGSTTCMGRPGSDGYEQQDADTYAEWGVDYLKEDSCGGTEHGTIWEQYERMRDALNNTGRPIYFSITQALPYTDNHPNLHCYGDQVFTLFPWVETGYNPIDLANSYLVEYCNNMDFFGYTNGVPQPGGFLNNLDSQALLTYDNLTTTGAYNDADMLEVCNGGQTDAEYRSQFSTWSILTSPLILGNDVRNLSNNCTNIILNKEVIAVNQDANTVRGKLVSQWPDAVWPNQTATSVVTLQPCDVTIQQMQKWVMSTSDGTIRLQSSNTNCLDVYNCSLTKPLNLGLYACHVGQEGCGSYNQEWKLDTTKLTSTTIASALDNYQSCITVLSDNMNVQTMSCLNNDKTQLFSYQSTTAMIQHAATGYCLTSPGLITNPINITTQVWTKNLKDGSIAAVAFNRGDVARDIPITWEMLGLDINIQASVRDLWLHQDMGVFSGKYTPKVGVHDVSMVRVIPIKTSLG